MIGHGRWLDLPDGMLGRYRTEERKKQWVEGFLAKNYPGWKAIKWNVAKERVLIRWEGKK